MKQYILLFFLLVSTIALSQTDDFFADDGFFDEDTSNVAIDTTIQGNSFFKIFKGEPGKAALLSLVIPGGGQIYNRSWWKVPLAIGIDATTLYFLIDNTRRHNELDDAYKGLLNGTLDNYRGISNASTLKPFRDNARKAREYSYIYLIAGHLITVFDAFVDNQLKDFDVSDDLSFEIKSGDDLGARLSMTISLSTEKYKKVATP